MPSKKSNKSQSFPTDNSMNAKLLSYLQKWTYGQTQHDVFLILLIQFNVTIYALSFWMQQPVLPFIIEKLGSSLNEDTDNGESGGIQGGGQLH